MSNTTIKKPDNLTKSYIVCSTGRSGSTMLCRTLSNLRVSGKPDEFFHDSKMKQMGIKNDPYALVEYINSIFPEATTDNGVCGIKIHYWDMHNFCRTLKKLDSFANKSNGEILQDIFPNLHLIYIWREDMVKQAISTNIALQRNFWTYDIKKHKNDNSQTSLTEKMNQKLVFQPLKIYRWKRSFVDQNRRWQELLTSSDLKYYEIKYEDLIDDFTKEILKITKFLGIEENIDPDLIEIKTQKLYNEINDKFYQQYKLFPEIVWKAGLKIREQLQKK